MPKETKQENCFGDSDVAPCFRGEYHEPKQEWEKAINEIDDLFIKCLDPKTLKQFIRYLLQAREAELKEKILNWAEQGYRNLGENSIRYIPFSHLENFINQL